MQKTEIRNRAKKLRKTLNHRELSKKIHENLFSLPEWINSSNIFCYYSVNDEVITTDLFLRKEKKWFLPRISDKNLLVCPYNNCRLIPNKYNIPEPDTGAVDSSKIDMVIIPALAADKNGNRIGYGGGYYDRFLSSLPQKTIKVLLLYSDLILENIIPDEFDIKCDIIVTDKEIYKINC